MKRSISAISADDGSLYALADDGTLWKLGPDGRSWSQIPSLPDAEKQAISESAKAGRPKLAEMD